MKENIGLKKKIEMLKGNGKNEKTELQQTMYQNV